MSSGTKRRLRVVFVQRHYLPDVPTYCELSHGIASMLAETHDVSVITAAPSYQDLFDGPEPPKAEEIDGVSVTRLELLSSVPPMIAFATAAGRELRKRRDEIDLAVVVSEPPVLLPFVVTAAAGSSFKTIQLLQDIHPEAGEQGGAITNGAVLRTLRGLDAWTAKRADCTVVLSDDMAQTYGTTRPVKDLEVINNYRLGSPSEPPPNGMISEDTFNVTFAGNVGKFQNVDVLVDAAALLLREPDYNEVVFHIVGSGSELERLTRRVTTENLTNLLVHGRLSRAKAQGFMERSDVGIITLEPRIHRYSYPSKTMAYLDAGCELLAIVEAESSLADDIEQGLLGSVASPNGDSVAAAVRKSFDRRASPPADTDMFDRTGTFEKWRNLVERVA